MPKEIRLLSTSAILGYGFPEASLKAGMARDPHFIGVDGGIGRSWAALSGVGQTVLLTDRDPAGFAADVAARRSSTESPW